VGIGLHERDGGRSRVVGKGNPNVCAILVGLDGGLGGPVVGAAQGPEAPGSSLMVHVRAERLCRRLLDG
jgi:hypothetical protein